MTQSCYIGTRDIRSRAIRGPYCSSGNAHENNHYNAFENYTFKIKATDNEFKLWARPSCTYLVDSLSMVESLDEVLSWGAHQGVFYGTEQDTIQLLDIMLLELLWKRGKWEMEEETQSKMVFHSDHYEHGHRHSDRMSYTQYIRSSLIGKDSSSVNWAIINSDNSLSLSSHYLNQRWLIVNWTLGNKFQWNLDQNSTI